MDVESLAKELILKNMTPEQQMAVLDSVKQSVADAREVQKRKIGENVDLVVQALKKIESDIRDRFDSVGNAIEKRVSSIQDGRDGSNGKDGRDGKDGKSGKDGAKGDKGNDGRDGRDGMDGVNGVSVTDARIDFDGSLVITLSTGVELNVGEVVAPDLAESIKVITNGGGTSQSVLDTLASLQTQITNLIPSQTGNSGKYLTTNGTALSWASVAGGLTYQGTWNATTNTPTLTSSVGTNGYYYIVATAGSTNLNGITDWQIGDWLMFNGSVWQKIDQSNLVTSVAGKTGDVVLNNTDVSAFLSIAATGGTTVLTSSSAPNYVVTGSGGHTFQLPNATTLPNGAIFFFNNNQSSGTVVVKNNSSTTIETLQSGGYVSIVLLSNAIAAGSWDEHNYAPTNVSWSTNTLDYAGSITSATWNGNAVAYNRGGTGQSSAFVTGGVVYGSSTSALAVTPIGTTGQVLTSAGTGTPTWTTPTTGTVTSVTGTSPVSSSGGNTPAISLAASYGDTQNPFASKTANYVLAAPNGSAGVPTFRAIVAADIPTLNQNTTGTASNVTGTVAIANGGTGLTSTPTNGQLNIGNGTGFTRSTLTGTTSQVTVTNASGSITLSLPSTINVNTSGSAATLTTTRAIYGNNFDGSAALTQIIASTYGGTGNGFTKFSGATTAERTYTLPDATTTILTTNAAVTVGQGGTGQTSYTDGQLLIGNTTGNTLTKATLTAGTGISITNGSGSISIASTATGTGTVTSVAATVPAFLSITGSPITTTGTLAIGLSGTALPVANGGTGATTLDGAGIVTKTDTQTLTNKTLTAPVISSIVNTGTLTLPTATGTLALTSNIVGIQPISASVSASALTISASALSLDFRSSTLGSGTVTTVSGTPANLVISSGSTLGTVSAQQSRIVVIAMNNAGTIELAAVNISGGNQLDETNLISTTAEGGAGAADSANVIYSTTARTSLAYRVIGFIQSTQATAGTWATAPSTIQGVGGQALTAMSSIGYGQVWQSVTRTSGTTYYNTTGKPIMLSAGFVQGNSASTLAIGGVSVPNILAGAAGGAMPGSWIIPPGASYVITDSGTNSRSGTVELR